MGRPTSAETAAARKREKELAEREDPVITALRRLCKDGAFPHVQKLISFTLNNMLAAPSLAVTRITYRDAKTEEVHRLTLADYQRFITSPDAPYVNGKLDPVLAIICKTVSFEHPIQIKAAAEAAAAENARRHAERGSKGYEPITSLVDRNRPKHPGRRRPALDDGEPIVGADYKLVM